MIRAFRPSPSRRRGNQSIEFDDRGIYEAFKRAATAVGLDELVERIEAGYLEETPGDGIHWLYFTDKVLGNTKLAERPGDDPKERTSLIETRGEGGYVVIAPSGGPVHESGRPYVLIRGGVETIATIAREEREWLWALAQTFDEMPPEGPKIGGDTPDPRAGRTAGGTIQPGEDYAGRTSWEEVLNGWTMVYSHGGAQLWRRPGKSEGWSASVNHGGGDSLFVFSTSTPFKPRTYYSKFGAYAQLEHGGDFQAATRALSRAGYGTYQTWVEGDGKPRLETRWNPCPKGVRVARPGEAAPSRPTDDGRRGRRKNPPTILCSDVSLALATGQTVRAIARKNVPPVVFNTGGKLSRIKQATGEDSRPLIDVLSQDALRNRCAEVATFLEVTRTSKGAIEREVFPPKDIVRAVMALPRWSTRMAPLLNSIAEVPRFQRDGRLITAAGYHPGSKLYYAPLPGMQDLDVPPIPHASQVDGAKALILGEYLVDFPFADQASRANALACMLLPFVRLMIPGPTPLHLFEASTEGTGKGKLANACAFPALGRELESTPQKEDEAEWRKALTTALVSGVDPIFFDNMYNPRGWDDTPLPIDSGTLAMALTQAVWRDRILGVTRDATITIRSVFMASGNNLEWSKELKRRIVPITLRTPIEDPSERGGFKHDPLEEWARRRYAELLHACLILCQNWIAEGRPMGRQVMGSYEEFARVMGGVLDAASVGGFLENRTKGGVKDRESIRWGALVQVWHASRGSMPTSSSQLHELIFGDPKAVASEGDADLQVAFAEMGEGSPLSQKQKLGNALRKQEGRVWGSHRIVLCDVKGNTGTLLYKLTSSRDGEAE